MPGCQENSPAFVSAASLSGSTIVDKEASEAMIEFLTILGDECSDVFVLQQKILDWMECRSIVKNHSAKLSSTEGFVRTFGRAPEGFGSASIAFYKKNIVVRVGRQVATCYRE